MRLITACFVFISLHIFGQKTTEVYFNCFKNGDTLTLETIDAIKELSLVKDGKITSDCWFKSWDLLVYSKGQSAKYSCLSGVATVADNMKAALKKADKFNIQNIIIYDKSGLKIVEKRYGPFTFYIGKEANKICGATLEDTKINVIKKVVVASSVPAKPPLLVEFSGKILMGKERNKPFMNQKITMLDQITKELQSTMTNNYGDFTFKNINANDSVEMKFDGNTKEVLDGELYMAKSDGTIIRGFNKANNVFYYDFIPPELVTLTQVKAEDTELKIKNFNNSNQSEMTVVEDIHYAPNSAEIDVQALKKIDKIVNALAQNKLLKLTISSHTDSKGDDAYNLTLSQKRAQKVMDYFIQKGIDKSRLVANGFGETKILNRCKNGVECSEAEHEVNRRTEFKFTK